MTTMRPTPVFTDDWLGDKKDAWLVHVAPHLPKDEPAHWLEIGAYEGLSALWTLDHLLPPGSRVDCVDIFDDQLSHVALWGHCHYAERFDANTAGRPIRKLKGWSRDVLRLLQGEDARYHGAYVDGGHEKKNVKIDMALVWEMLLPGAVMVCDDYGEPDGWGTKQGIDEFLAEHRDAKILYVEYQIIVLKQP